jgi:heme o synthase
MSTVSQPLAVPRQALAALVRDYAELTKLRVTTLVVMTAWCGYYFGSLKSGVPSLSWGLFHALLGVGLVSGGTAALNEVLEHDVDGLMRRTALRPLPSGRMSVWHGAAAGLLMTIGGAVYLGVALNTLTGWLSLLTAFVYLAAYTPLKKVHPICTFVGAFPGAMPGVLGWAAVRGRLEWGALVMFAIVFFWQFPHFFSIAWLYREDYAAGQIQMLPVVEPEGRSTVVRIIFYSVALIPVSLAPTFLGMALLYFGIRLASARLPVSAARSKQRARQLLQATVIYLPLLFVLMMLNRVSS